MQGIFQKENTDKALKYGIYRHLPTYEKIIRNLVSFYIKNGYHIYVDEYEKIKCWHSIVASAEVEYKSELNYLRRTGKKNQLFERIKKQVEESAGDEKYIEFECVDMMDIFKYGIITEEEYLKKLKECHYPTYVGNLNAGCINKEQSSEEKRSNC